ncbi:hypothetical protein JMJ35_000832 [Cladonia borealis]|uniref:Uncharacterized protein n=1 Tax=Cladonia borealis TaxID=184061 RepID=A0AA39R9J9_9LECA|nr:hypothetical protein JMJ35_000832 [Cladonia borealis]
MSKVIQLHRRKFIAGGVLIGAWALVQNGILPNPFYTPGVQNIEKRYSSLGGAKNHQPAVATKKGDSEDVVGRQETQKGMGTPYHQEKIGEQRSDPSTFDKTWNQAQYHAEKGK